MRKANFRVILILVIVAIAGLAILLLSGKSSVQWWETYRPDDKQPYGATVFHQLLKDVRQGQPFHVVTDTLANELPEDPGAQVDNYLFIGNEAYPDSADTEQLIRFVQAGNNAFFLVNTVSNRFLDSLLVLEQEVMPEAVEPEMEEFNEDEGYSDEEVYEEEYYENESWEIEQTSATYYDSCATLYLNNKNLIPYPLVRRFEYERGYNNWTYLQDKLASIDGNEAEVLGQINRTYTNFIRVKYGKGFIYVHTTPLAFTNYFMLSDTVNDYTREVMSYLGEGHIYWDEENRDYDFKAYKRNMGANLSEEGPLEFILSERPLRTAWYLLLLAALLYLIFGARRQQRIIAVADNMDNTSIEYAEVISQLFMKQSDHKKLILLKMELFKAHLRERFMIRLPLTGEEENGKLFAHIAQRSGVDQSLIESIFTQYHYLSVIEGVSTASMLEFHQKIEQFYVLSK